jgi:hypothetical protein
VRDGLISIAAALLVILVSAACFAAGYVVAKGRYECRQVGGASQTYKGHVEKVRYCR